MTSKSIPKSTYLILPILITLLAILMVQRGLFSGTGEIIIRKSTRTIAIVGVPALLILAWRDWTKYVRSDSPAWRNRAGLSSIMLISGVFVLFAVSKLLISVNPHAAFYVNLDWLSVLLYSNLLALALAFLLKGAARTEGIAAAILTWAWLASDIYS
jgi:hypothetical protein